MDTPESIRERAETLRAMAASNRADARQEYERGNILLAKSLRERAEIYAHQAATLLAKVAEFASMMFVFVVFYAIWSVTP